MLITVTVRSELVWSKNSPHGRFLIIAADTSDWKQSKLCGLILKLVVIHIVSATARLSDHYPHSLSVFEGIVEVDQI